MSGRARGVEVDAARADRARSAAASPALAAGESRRVVIEGIEPCIDGGRFPAKRSVGEAVEVSADIFADGHDVLAAVLRYRHGDDTAWHEVPMVAGVNDRWEAPFTVDRLGRYEYALSAWVDAFASWRAALL